MSVAQIADQTSGSLDTKAIRRRSRFADFAKNKSAVIGLVLVIILILIAIFAPILAPADPLDQSVRDRLAAPSTDFPLGRDDKGRDILSRIIYGTRIALQVGILSVLFGGVVGTLIGAAAGFFGGFVDAILMRLTDVLLAFPDLITGLLVLVVLGSGLDKMIFAIGITIIPRFARLSYGPALSVKNKDFIEAARAMGQSRPRILFRHLLPNISGELVVFASLWTASAIRLEASLSFIGLGVPPPTPTWGQMIREGTFQLQTSPLFSLAPGIALLITVLAFNLMGDGLRDAFDPRSR